MLGDIDLIFWIVMSYRSSLHFLPGQWFLAELWLLDFEIWPKIQLSPVCFALLGDIDLIFGIWVYSDELQIKFTFCSGSMIFGSWILNFCQIFSCHHFVHYACWYWLNFWHMSVWWWATHQIYILFRSNDFWPSYGPWTLKFGQIFSCHHFVSLCLEILTWFFE